MGKAEHTEVQPPCTVRLLKKSAMVSGVKCTLICTHSQGLPFKWYAKVPEGRGYLSDGPAPNQFFYTPPVVQVPTDVTIEVWTNLPGEAHEFQVFRVQPAG